MADLTLKQHDLLPEVTAILKLGGAVFPLTAPGAAIKFGMRSASTGVIKVNAAATILDAANGVAQYVWQLGDTDTVDDYYGEFQYKDNSSGPLTFPQGSYIWIRVVADIAS